MLAVAYGGKLKEVWTREGEVVPLPDATTYCAQIDAPTFFFKMESDLQKDEPVWYLRERTLDQLMWLILQKGMEFAKENGEIHKMFNPKT